MTENLQTLYPCGSPVISRISIDRRVWFHSSLKPNMPALPKYIQQRRQGYYAVLEIPKNLREHFGKHRFIESLKTRDLKIAERRVLTLVSKWKAALEKAKGTNSLAASLLWEALEWRRMLDEEENLEVKQTLEEVLSYRLDKIIEEHGEKLAIQTASIASETTIPLAVHIAPWLKTITHLSQKTIDTHARYSEDPRQDCCCQDNQTEVLACLYP